MQIFQNGLIMCISEKTTWVHKLNGGFTAADAKVGFWSNGIPRITPITEVFGTTIRNNRTTTEEPDGKTDHYT